MSIEFSKGLSVRYHLLSQLVNISQVEFTAHSQAALQLASCRLAHAVQTSMSTVNVLEAVQVRA